MTSSKADYDLDLALVIIPMQAVGPPLSRDLQVWSFAILDFCLVFGFFEVEEISPTRLDPTLDP